MPSGPGTENLASNKEEEVLDTLLMIGTMSALTGRKDGHTLN